MKKLFMIIKSKLHKIFSFLHIMIIIFTIMLVNTVNTTTAIAVGTNTVCDIAGGSRQALISWLTSHENDTYYITTPYEPYDRRNPNGDCAGAYGASDIPGVPGMNCTGFVWHALTFSGMSGIPGLQGWLNFIEDNNIINYEFPDKASMLASGVLEKGDVIWIWDSSVGKYGLSDDHHVGIFWGNTPSEDLFWNSNDKVPITDGNYITDTKGKTTPVTYMVVKLDNGGYIDLEKRSSNTSISDGNSYYSLTGGVYSIYNNPSATGTPVEMLILNSVGYAKSGLLSIGTYYVKETTPSQGYNLDGTIYTVNVSSGQTTRVNGSFVTDSPQTGFIDIEKRSSNPSISDNNSCYSLAGGVYSIYDNSSVAGTPVGTLMLNSAGYAKSGQLGIATYYVKETTPSLGYSLDPTIYPVNVISDQTTRVNGSFVADSPQNNIVKTIASKIDSETHAIYPQGSATFEDTHFEIKFYDGYFSEIDQSWIAGQTPTRTWVIKTDKTGSAIFDTSHLVSGDPFYLTSGGIVTIPLGTLTLQEIKAPTGYLLGTQPIYIKQITSIGSLEQVDIFNPPEIEEQIKRGDINLIKAGEHSYERLANVPFRITSKTTGESHIIVTDANGYASTSASWNPHTQNTNMGLTSEDGVWFGEISAISNYVGALPFDTYTIEELECEANFNRMLIPPFDIVILRDNYTVPLGTLLNGPPIFPQIGTTALDGYTKGKYVSADVEAIITDTISYSNLFANREYKFVGLLMDKATGTPIQVNGSYVREEQTFTATSTTPITSGTINMTFNFDASSLGGKDVVVFEYIYYEGTLLGSHEDLDDDGQTVHILNPKIGTTALDEYTSTHVASADSDATIVDKVRFENLIIGKNYNLEGVLMDKTTNSPLLLDGNEVRVNIPFIPETTNGTIDMVFTFDASSLGGKDIVVFEYLTKNRISVATHTDINDEGQTITLMSPQIATTVKDGYVRPYRV